MVSLMASRRHSEEGCEVFWNPSVLSSPWRTEKFEQLFGPHALVIFEETSADWMTACIGAMSQSLPVATLYSTLGMPAVAEVLFDCSAAAVLCNYRNVQRIIALVPSCPNLKLIVYSKTNVEANVEASEPSQSEVMSSHGHKVTVMSFDEVVALGDKNAGIAFTPPSPEHLALIMYTSGTTGKPKGVMLKHANTTAAIGGFVRYMEDVLEPPFTKHGQQHQVSRKLELTKFAS